MGARSIRRMAAMIGTALTCFAATLSGINAQADERTVTVCTESGVAHEAGRAEIIAGQMFAEIGVRVDWHKESNCPEEDLGVIHMKLTTGIPVSRFPGALAAALPYEGVHIQVFVDRIRKSAAPRIEQAVLANAMAHEITHVLQGVSRHSESGIMKARWDHEDYGKMGWRPLPFTGMDVKLIYLGLDVRAKTAQIRQLALNSGTAVPVK